MKVINAEDKILGRLAVKASKLAKDGEEVAIVNSEKAVVSGKKEKVLEDYKTKKDRGTRDRGPYFPKRPDKIMKRTVKNMLPKNKEGREQLGNIKAYLEVPREFKGEVEEVDVKEGDDLRNRQYVKLGEISEHIGWTPKTEVTY